MNGELGSNAQAILLLTAPLLAGRSRTTVAPLPLGDYNKLALHLHRNDLQPGDLLRSAALAELDRVWPELKTRRTLADVHQLLNRGFLLAQALERWGARAIWVVTRADTQYPARLRKKMGKKAPPVLYGCGDWRPLDGGGLAVVGSRNVNDGIIEYTERVGRLAADADVAVVSGAARGVDQAAMRGSLEAGGRAIGVLGDNLERAALDRGNREPLMDGRLVLVSSFDPAVRFRGWQAMERNKQIYALADAALVVNSDHGHGGTWSGATEQLARPHYAPVYVRRPEEPCAGLDALVERGARPWPEPRDPADLQALLSVVEPEDSRTTGPMQGSLPFREPAGSEASLVREGDATGFDQETISETGSASREGPVPVQLPLRLLRAMSGEMTRAEIGAALGLKDWGNVRRRYVVPCLDGGWIEMTNPETPRSPKQRFRITAAGRAQVAPLDDK